MTPSRSAQGETSSSATRNAAMVSESTMPPADDLEGAILGDAGQRGPRLRRDAREPRHPVVELRAPQQAALDGPDAVRHRSGQTRERSDGLRRTDYVRRFRQSARRPSSPRRERTLHARAAPPSARRSAGHRAGTRWWNGRRRAAPRERRSGYSSPTGRELEGAAADVEQQDVLGRPADTSAAPPGR